MKINVHFLAEDGKKSTQQLEQNFTYRNFVDMVNQLFGPNSHVLYTFVAQGKNLGVDNEEKFKEKRQLITNSVNIIVGRRMHGGDC